MTPGSISDEHTANIGKAEVEFYSKVASEMTKPPLVRCFDAAFDAETGRSHILMEDLSATHCQPEQNFAPSESLTYLAIETLAKAHSVWWNRRELGTAIGKLFDQKTLDAFVTDLEHSVSDFIESSGVSLTSDERQAYRSMLNNADRIWGRLMDPTNLTVTQGDCHWWNFLYPIDSETNTVRIFDWHLWHVDLGARDLAFLLALGGFAEPRPELEDELLEHYYSTLISNGVSNYELDDLVHDYRCSAIRNLNIPIIFWTQGKHESTWNTALRRAFDSFDRLRCSKLFA